MDKEIALDQAFDYIDSVEKNDISAADGVQRNSVRTHRLLRSLARNQGSQANYSTIKADLITNESDTFDEDTIASYISALKKIFVIEDAEALNGNVYHYRDKNGLECDAVVHLRNGNYVVPICCLKD